MSKKVLVLRIIKIISFAILILTLLFFPTITNEIMNTTVPKAKVNSNNIWIGFFSSYFGGVFGGIIAGLLTYFGVKLTIKDNKEIRDNQIKKSNRALLYVSEIYGASFNLKNLENPKGRLIITEHYQYAIDNKIDDGNYSFIVLENQGPGVVINCNIEVIITFEADSEVHKIETFLSTIHKDDQIFIPIDKIPDTRKYRITGVSLKWETLLGEELMMNRHYEKLENNQEIVSDIHLIKDDKGKYIEIFKIKGSKTQWLHLG